MTKEKLKIIEDALRAKGIRLQVGSCGCCNSPWIAIEVDGKLLAGEIQPNGDVEGDEYAAIDMFEGGAS